VELSASLILLFKDKCIEAEFIAPEGRRETCRSATYDYDVKHKLFLGGRLTSDKL